MSKKYLNEREVAEQTSFAIQTLRNHRHESKGIPYLRIGKRSIRYKSEDVETYMERYRVEPEAA